MHLLSVSENILSFICEFGILQGLLLAGLIYFHPRGDKSVNIFLALYIIATSAVMALPFIIRLIGWKNSYLFQPIPLLTGPFLYFYLRGFMETVSWKKIWPHLIPFVAVIFLSYGNITVVGAKYESSIIIPEEFLRSWTTIALQFLKPAQQLIYFYLAVKTLQTYRRSIRQLYSETQKIDLAWCRFLVLGFLVLVLTYVLIFPMIVRYPQKLYLLILINMAVAVPYIYIATVKGLLQHTIWQMRPGMDKRTIQAELHRAEEISAKASEPHSPRPGPVDDKILDLVQRITHLMEVEKLYEEPELTLQQLAMKLEVPAYQVSQALNDGMNKNFYDVVNGYRVEEAKRLLLDPKNRNFTILSVGFEAGFNSKTTFNTVFKKFTGLTPTEFRQRENQLQPSL